MSKADGEAVATAIGALGAGSQVTAQEVASMRRLAFADGQISAAEMSALFALAGRAPNGGREWHDYFDEAGFDFFVGTDGPDAIMTAERFVLLKTMASRHPAQITPMVLSMMTCITEKASIPAAMNGFWYEQFRAWVETRADAPALSGDDVDLLRRFVFASGGDGNVAVTRGEASFLFDLADLVVGAENDDRWAEFFKQAISNHLMAHIGYVQNAGVGDDEEGSRVSRFFRAMVSPRNQTEHLFAELNARRSAEAAESERVTHDERNWLSERIGRDGTFSDVEKALLMHMKELGADLPDDIKSLVRMIA